MPQTPGTICPSKVKCLFSAEAAEKALELFQDLLGIQTEHSVITGL